MDFDNSHWVFRGNVKINMEQGQLTSDEADLTFAKKLLAKAVVNGKPAAFEQRIAKTGKLAHGRADSIDYDVTKGVVHLSKNAWLSDGQNEIRGESLKYNVTGPEYRGRELRTGFPTRAHHHHAAAQTQTMSVLRALNLAKSYKSRQVLRDLSLEVESGEVVGLLGPNGAGKTTAFYMIVGLTRCEHGEIFLDNRDISRLPMHRRAQLGLGYLPQEPSVFRRLSVADNIMAILETRPGLDDAGPHRPSQGTARGVAYRPRAGQPRGEPLRRRDGGGWKSPAPWRRTLGSSCWTNPLPVSTPCRSQIFRE